MKAIIYHMRSGAARRERGASVLLGPRKFPTDEKRGWPPSRVTNLSQKLSGSFGY